MPVAKYQEDNGQTSEISKFYDGKSVFITGTTGFLGKVILEMLLRWCPGIVRIYILLRPKRGLLVEDRKKIIFKSLLFHKLMEENPDVVNKVIAVAGDASEDNLGISEENVKKIIQEVSIVFHCAAALSLTKPVSFVMIQNVVATDNIIELCKKLPKLEAFIYTSTLYSNTNRDNDIDEIVYQLPFKAEEALQMTRKGDLDGLNHLLSKCNPKFINNYIFSKCVAENLLVEKAGDLPVSIIRPSLIISALKGALPGYIQDGFALFQFCLLIGKGVIRVVKVYGEIRMEYVPVDIAANTHIIAAFLQSTKNLTSPSVYNCTSGTVTPHTWEEFSVALLDLGTKKPLPNSYIIPDIIICRTTFWYNFFSFLYHIIPATLFDAFLWITGKKPRMLRLCRFQQKMTKIAEPILTRQWDYKCENFVSLSNKLSKIDAEIFNVDMRDFTTEKWAASIYTGAHHYRVNGKPYVDTVSACLLRYFITYLIKFSVLGFLATVFYLLFF